MNRNKQKRQQQKHLLETLLDQRQIPEGISNEMKENHFGPQFGSKTTRQKTISVKVPSVDDKPQQRNAIPLKKPISRKVVVMKNLNSEREKKKSNKPLFKAPIKSSLKKGSSSARSAFMTSTPADTPLKKKKITRECVSDTESTATAATRASSVQSSLIDLLKNYNASILDGTPYNINKNSDLQSVPQKLSPAKNNHRPNDQSALVKEDSATPNELAARKVKNILELTLKLSEIVGKIISSGDTDCLQRMSMVVMEIQRDMTRLQENLPSVEARYDRETELQKSLEPLMEEKASLQRKVRILNQNLKEKDIALQEKTTNKMQSEISLELATVQCMNSALQEQVRDLTSKVQEMKDEKLKLESNIRMLTTDNESIRQLLGNHDNNIQKQQEHFSQETSNIKKDVADALSKVETLNEQLSEAELENKRMKINVNEKEEEIARLNDLNKGLQNSVSRLLDDLRRTPAQPLPTTEVSSMILRTLDDVLKPTPRKFQPRSHKDDELLLPPFHTGSSDLAIQTDLEFKRSIDKFDRHRPSPMPMFDFPSPDSIGRSTAAKSDIIITSTGQKSPSCRSKSSDCDKSTISVKSGDPVTGIHRSHFTGLKTPSVMSSIVSFTSNDEREFAKNLSMLDIDIDMLKHNLHMAATN